MGAEEEYDSTENQTGTVVVGAALAVHSRLGPGLLESAYGICLAHEMAKRGLRVREQVYVPIHYDSLGIENGYRLDLLVEDAVVVELKSIEAVLPVHRGQVLSFLRLGGFRLGYLLNFNVAHMRDGITRLVNRL